MSTVLQQHSRTLGIYAFALWAVVLSSAAMARLLLLTQSVELYSNIYGNQAIVWLIFGLSTVFGLGFVGSSVGLWRRQNWGRILFLWLIVVWSGLNLTALFILPGSTPAAELSINNVFINGFRFVLGVTVSMWYLNLSRVKDVFDSGPANNFSIEG